MQGTVTADSSMPMGEGAEGQPFLVAGVMRLWEGTHNWQGFPNTFPPESFSQQAAPQHLINQTCPPCLHWLPHPGLEPSRAPSQSP